MKGYSAPQFCSWQKTMGWRNSEVATQLGCNLQAVSKFRGNGCGRRVALACRALAVEQGHARHQLSYPWEQVSPNNQNLEGKE